MEIIREPTLASYLGFPKKKEEGWIFVEKTRTFKSLLEALEISQELMEKNKKIIKVILERKLSISMESPITSAIVFNNWKHKKTKNKRRNLNGKSN